MAGINKTTHITSRITVPSPQKTDGTAWDKNMGAIPQEAPSSRTMTLRLERAPKNITNQNGMLTPHQMAQHLSKELARRARIRGKGRRGISNLDGDLSVILDENKELSSLLDSGDEGSIAAFLAFFQSEMERHLEGMEFGEIIYDQDLIDRIMQRY